MAARLIQFPVKNSRSTEQGQTAQLANLAAVVKSFAEQANFLAVKAAAVVKATEASRRALKKLTD